MSSPIGSPVLPRSPLAQARQSVARAVKLAYQQAADPMLFKVAISLGDQAVVSATNFATSVILGKCCDNESLGVYYLALSLAYFIRGMQEQLIAAPYMIYANKYEPERLPRYSGSVLVHELALMLLTCGIIGGAAWWMSDGSELSQVLWILAGAAPLMLVREFARQFSFARMNLVSATVLDITVGVLQIALLLPLAGTGTLSTPIAFLVIALSVALPTLCWLAFWRGTFRAEPKATIEDARQNWTFGKWAVASTLLACIASYAMPWVLKFHDGEGAAGILGAAATLAGLANMFVLGMSNFFAPRAARAYATGGIPALQAVLLKAAALYSVVLGPLVICAFFAGDQVMRLVYRDGLDGAGQIIAVLALGQWINSMGITAGNGLWAIERPAANFAADAINLAATFVITVLLLLVGWLDPLGAACATVAGLAVGAIVRSLILMRHLKELEPAKGSQADNGSTATEGCPC